jgi:hypothetical protein
MFELTKQNHLMVVRSARFTFRQGMLRLSQVPCSTPLRHHERRDGQQDEETMGMNISFARLGVAACILVFSSGCITDATVDLTKAPFNATTDLTDATTDATSRLTDGTSQGTTDLTEPTKEFLSSTTPGAWFRADGTLNQQYKQIAFAVLNFDNLQKDMARGEGEYLVSYSTLLGVPLHSRDRFFEDAQNQYGYIYQKGQPRPEALRCLIQA